MTITYDDDGTEIVATYCYNDLSSNITVCVFAKKETKNVTACRDYVLQAGLVHQGGDVMSPGPTATAGETSPDEAHACSMLPCTRSSQQRPYTYTTI